MNRRMLNIEDLSMGKIAEIIGLSFIVFGVIVAIASGVIGVYGFDEYRWTLIFGLLGAAFSIHLGNFIFQCATADED